MDDYCIILPDIISIHALREEGDLQGFTVFFEGHLFLSTPSARRATNAVQLILESRSISIHALREEGDPMDICETWRYVPFLSTPSARRATYEAKDSKGRV